VMIKPEVMSPAGYWPQVCAAIEAGADAVYFGLKHFTARVKVGFLLGELPEVLRTLHRRGRGIAARQGSLFVPSDCLALPVLE
jgi:putative protease